MLVSKLLGYIFLSLEQKLACFFVVEKISIIFVLVKIIVSVETCRTTNNPLMFVCNRSPCILNQICSQKLQVCSSMHRLLLRTDIKELSLNDLIQRKF